MRAEVPTARTYIHTFDDLTSDQAFGGVPDSVLYEFEELRKMKIEPQWKGLIIASDGAWDALPPDAIWRSFSDSANASPAETEDERLAKGLQTMVEACCMSDYWTNHGYDADNTTAIALSFNGSFAPSGGKETEKTKGKEAEDSKEEVRSRPFSARESFSEGQLWPNLPRCGNSN